MKRIRFQEVSLGGISINSNLVLGKIWKIKTDVWVINILLCLTQVCIFKTSLYTKTKVLLEPGLKSFVIPPIVKWNLVHVLLNIYKDKDKALFSWNKWSHISGVNYCRSIKKSLNIKDPENEKNPPRKDQIVSNKKATNLMGMVFFD